MFGNLLYSWDNLQHSWNDWVINYDNNKQQRFLKKLDIGIDNASDMVIALVILLVSVSGSFWLLGWYRERPLKPAAYEIYFRRFLRKMTRIGFDKQKSEDYRHFLYRIDQSGIEQNELIAKIISLYILIKYGRRDSSDRETSELKDLVKSLQV